MAHETVRDVIIRISLQQKDAALKVPDFGPWYKEIDRVRKEMGGLNRLPSSMSTSAQSVGTPKLDQLLTEAEAAADNYERSLKEAEQAQEALDKAARESEKAAVKAAKEAEKAQVKAAKEAEKAVVTAAKEAAKAEQEAAKAAREWEKAVADLANGDFDGISNHVLKTERSYYRAAQAAEKSGAIQTKAYVEIADKTKAAGEGAITLARGIAFMTASTDEDFQESLQTIAKFQGAFDVFKGGTDVIKATYEATKVLSTANKAAAASEMVLATATGASSVAMGGLATTATAANIALSAGVLGAAVLAVTAIGTAAYYVAGGFEDVEEKSTDALDAVRDKATAAQEAMSRLEAMTDRYRSSLDFESTAFDVGTERLSTEEKIAKNKERQAKLQDQISKSEMLLRNAPFMSDESKAAELDALNATYGELAQRQKQMADLERQSLTDKARGLELRRDELQTMKEIVNQSRDEVESLEEKIGRMSSQEYSEFKVLSERVKSGKANDQELGRFEQLGGQGVSEFTSNIYQERGRQRGGTENFLPFDPNVMTREKLGQQQDFVSEEQDTFQRLEAGMKQMQMERKLEDAAGADRLIATMKQVFVTKGMWDDLTRRLSAAKQ